MATLANDQKNTATGKAPKRLAQALTVWDGISYILWQWRPYWQPGVVIIFSLLAHELFRTFFALQLKQMIDSLQATGAVTNLRSIMGILVISFFLALAIRLRGERLNAQISVTILNQLRLTLFQQLQRLPQNYYTRTASSDILARFSNDLSDVERVITVKLRDGLLNLILFLLNLPVLFYIDWRLGLVPLLNLLLLSRVIRYFMPKAAQAGGEFKSAEAQLTGDLQENIQAQALIRAFGFEDQLRTRFQQKLAQVGTLAVRVNLIRTLASLSARSIILFSRVVAVGVGVFLVMRNSMTIGDFVAFFNLLTLVNNAVDDLTRTVLPDLMAATSGIQRIKEFLAEGPDLLEAPNAVAIPAVRQQIQLKDLAFGYTKEAHQLQEINLLLPAGQTVAVVGPSGSGKSTLLTLLMGGHVATAGTIRFDGVDIRQIQRASLQQQIGVVFQDTYLFKTTIRENIRMAKPTATDADVEQAAKLAEIHDLIMQLPNQYETEVGEAGSRLSGGQRQRIAIARAIIRDPALLILDEATSALDPGTEAAINATLQRVGQARTVITVTHRLSTIAHADQIVVLSGGRLVEVGTHAQLLARLGLYAQLWHKQSGFEISADGRMATVHASYLGQLPLFAPLDTAVRSTIASRFTTQFINGGQMIFQQGDVGDRFYLIARGQVEVLVRNAQGVEQKIDTMSDGDYFGETALLHDAPRNATIRTVTDCLLLILPKQAFLTLLDELPALRTAVGLQVERTQRNREQQQVDEEIVQPKPPATRLAQVRNWWQSTAGRPQENR